MATGRKGSKLVSERGASSSEKKPQNGTRSAGPAGLAGTVDTVRALAEVLAEHGLGELIVELPEGTITLRRGGMVAMPSMPSATAMPSFAPHVQHSLPAAPPSALPGRGEPPPAVHDASHVVTSPFVGTFYRRPNPDSAEFCKLNDKVDKGATLCIVEAMKLMNEIEADIAGTIVGVLAEDGSAVEYGQPLFKIMPA